MSRTSKYYTPTAIKIAERKLAKLNLLHEIEELDRKLRILNDLCSLYSPPRTDDEQSCAVHSAPTS